MGNNGVAGFSFTLYPFCVMKVPRDHDVMETLKCKLDTFCLLLFEIVGLLSSKACWTYNNNNKHGGRAHKIAVSKVCFRVKFWIYFEQECLM